jgi:ABC-type Mn2+/Zn2+ transport system permease subunit
MMEQWMVPFQYEYLVKAMVVCAFVGAVCGALSAMVTLKGWSLLGDALSHAVVPGVVLAHLLSWPLAVGSLISGVLAAGAMTWVKAHSRLREDAVMGVVFTTFFAIGLLGISLYPSQLDLKSIVFGNVLAIAPKDLWQVIGMGGFVALVLLLKWRDMMLFCFDEQQARVQGLNVRLLHAVFLLLLSAMAVAALMTVGALLVVAMLITPGATAYLLTNRFSRMMILSTVFGGVTSALGAYASYFVDGSTGACIVSLQALLFLLCLWWAPQHGWFAQRRREKEVAS